MSQGRFGGFLSKQDLEESWLTLTPQRLQGQSVVILGASGCLGGAIAEAILHAQRQGIGCRLCLIGRSVDRLTVRVGEFLEDPACDLQLLEWDAVTGAASDIPPWTLAVHAASDASPQKYLARPMDTFLANSRGLEMLLLSRSKSASSRLLYISSGEIYGSPSQENIPTPEGYRAVGDHLDDRSCYREAKQATESLLWAARKQLNITAAIARPIHVYGPGLYPNDGRVICDFLSQAVRNETITMLSDGSAQRAFCYVSDATRLHLALLLDDRDGLVVNIGRAAPLVSIAELADLVAETFDAPAVERPETVPEHVAGSPQRSCPDMSIAEQLFQYEPCVPLVNGLQRTAQWWKDKDLL